MSANTYWTEMVRYDVKFYSTFKVLRSSAMVNHPSAMHDSISSQNHESNISVLATISLSDMEPS